MSEPRPLLARFGDFLIDEGNARLSRAGRPVDLPPKAFAVLCTLMRQPGQLVVKDALLDAVWGHRHVSESVLKTTISQLRGALADDAKQPRYIETASRRGYRFIAALGAAPSAHASPPAEPSPRPEPAGEWVGRGAVLDSLHDDLAAALGGKRQVVLVAGEAGIGKTTLIDRFVAQLPASGPLYALGQCVQHYGVGEPYMPVLEALNMLCRGAAGAALLELMRRVAPTWLVQLPWFLGDADRHQLQREVSGATQDRMLREFGELLDGYTAQHPVLLVLEDLHWSDHATVQLIGYLARRRTGAALMLLASFRLTEVIVDDHPLASLRQELRLHRLCREIDLEAFSEAEVDALVEIHLDGQRAPEDFVRALHAHTEGLPLFVVNVLDELVAAGALHHDDQGWTFPDPARLTVPASIVGVIEKQIARLPAEQRQWLGVASVCGAEFIHVPLADALQMPPDALHEVLDAAAARHQWLRSLGVSTLPDGRLAARYAFRHVLYRHVFYQQLGEVQRMRLHRQIAAALLAAYGPRSAEVAAELAMHFERGNEPEPAIGQLAIVAARALARSAAHEAVNAVRHGLQLFSSWSDAAGKPEIELRLRALEGVALARLHVISDPEVAAAFERTSALCDRVGSSPARAMALHGLWWVSFARGELPRARAHARRILALARGDANPGLQVAGANAMGMTLAMLGDLPEARRHLEAALDAYARVDHAQPAGLSVQDPGVEAKGCLAVVSWWMGEPARARALAADSIALALEIRHPISQLIALHFAAALHYFAGEIRQTLALTDRITEVIRTHHLPPDPGAFSWLHGHAVAALGNVEEGLAEMRDAERSCRRLGMRVSVTGFHLHYAEACRDAGMPDDASAAIESGLALARDERYLLAPLHRVKAELLLDQGDADGAASSMRTALTIAADQGARFHELATLVSAHRLADFRTPAHRERLRDLLAAYRDEDIPIVAAARDMLTGPRPPPS